MISTLLEAITDTRKLIENFTRYEYRAAYKAYAEKYEPIYTAAVRQSDNLSQMADQLLDALTQYQKKLHFWNRSAASAEQKIVMVSYLSPMLLGAEEPRCRELAKALCAKWRERRPSDAYEMAEFEEIIGGFRHSIMGIDLANKHFRKEKEQ